MKATVNIQLDKRSTKKDGTHPVVLLIYFSGQKRRYPMRKSFSQLDYDKLMSSRVRDNDLRSERAEIEKRKARADAICDKLGANFSFSDFDALFRGVAAVASKEKQNVYVAFDVYVDLLRSQERIGTADSYHAAKRSLQAYCSTLLFSMVTPEFLGGYERFMLDKGKSVTTIGIYLRSLRTIMNNAKYQGIITEAQYPFGQTKHRKYQIPVGKNIKKTLTKSQIAEIENYRCDSEEFARARDIWVFSYYMGGMNLTDILRLTFKNLDGNFLLFRRTKTVRTQRSEIITELAISSEAQAIIDRWADSDKSPSNYVFPILTEGMKEGYIHKQVRNYNRSVSQYLERLKADIKLDAPLSMMTARHSFASISLQEAVPLKAISESMGHSSMITTENYIKGFDRQSKAKFANLLSTKK